MKPLTCDSCPETAESVGMAVGHVTDNPGHAMTGPATVEGATVTVSIADDDDIVDDFDEDDDWNASDQ